MICQAGNAEADHTRLEILEGLQQGDLEQRLDEVLAEGRRLYQQSIRQLTSVADEVFEEAVKEMMESIKRRGSLGERQQG